MLQQCHEFEFALGGCYMQLRACAIKMVHGTMAHAFNPACMQQADRKITSHVISGWQQHL